MIMSQVSSSRISKVGWEHNTLYIQFKNGVMYEYINVSKSEYESFLASPSLGSALSRLDKIHDYNKL
ncbi:KTSC domain-containing protein [Clostridium gasigenes]|uniref:KTSC domain-containing protein n=1 Tax=Clostridium gasigenes TaxID=94869 RepID=A0A1H0VLJ3_9CLOT|nr:KTSC domain-containing protein [Clostridium gasigenes]MBU3106968.1 KTSC domain-containing protein [Clostridium gasigenes]SDP79310.1 KTSC domain-containing protein [Clostridium gasigenes]